MPGRKRMRGDALPFLEYEKMFGTRVVKNDVAPPAMPQQVLLSEK